MKTNHLKAIAAAVILTSYAGIAAAGGTQDVQVTAHVNAVCKFKTQTPVIALGTIDPSSVSADVSNFVDVTYQCTKGTTPTFTGGGARNLSNGTDSVPYTFSVAGATAGSGFSAAGTSKVTATATVALADAQDAPAGDYTDTVTLTISN